MTLDEFFDLCNKNHITAEKYSDNWYIANIKSKYISSSWIITHCTAYSKTLLPKDICTDCSTITYSGNTIYNEADFNSKLEIVRELLKVCKKREIAKKLEGLKNDFL